MSDNKKMERLSNILTVVVVYDKQIKMVFFIICGYGNMLLCYELETVKSRSVLCSESLTNCFICFTLYAIEPITISL